MATAAGELRNRDRAIEPQKNLVGGPARRSGQSTRKPSRAKYRHRTLPRIRLNATRADKILEFHQTNENQPQRQAAGGWRRRSEAFVAEVVTVNDVTQDTQNGLADVREPGKRVGSPAFVFTDVQSKPRPT